MFHAFEGHTAEEVYDGILSTFRTPGQIGFQPSRAGDTQELLHATISIADPRQRWLASRTPALNPAFAIAEAIWILRGRNDSRFLTFFNSELPKFAGVGPTFYGAYGHRLRRNLGIDQLERAFHALKNNPESRQVVLQIWDAEQDFPDEAGAPKAEDIPCNLLSMLKVRDGALEWTQVIRSNDVYRGLPYNLVQFTTLQEVMAGWLGLKLGSYNQLSDSLHVYARDLKAVVSSAGVQAQANEDNLSLPKAESDRVFAAMEKHVETLINNERGSAAPTEIVKRRDLPQPYRNMICVLSAEAARRARLATVATEIMAECSNPVFCQLFERWCKRFKKAG
ncbi:MAG TPA: thymidylate synthase [Planctomycetota bacterium]|jgi:thymidylate synthase